MNKRKTGKYIICPFCKKEFYIPKNRFNTAKYCSKKCKWNYEHTTLSVNKYCEICGKEFNVVKFRGVAAKYCSRTCFYKAMSKKGTIEKECKNCGITFKTSPSKNKIFCSNNCFFENKKKNYKVEHPGSIRTFMKRRNMIKKCEMCGYDEIPEILGIHHKNKNNKDNRIENIIVLCPNCHSIEHMKHIPIRTFI